MQYITNNRIFLGDHLHSGPPGYNMPKIECHEILFIYLLFIINYQPVRYMICWRRELEIFQNVEMMDDKINDFFTLSEIQAIGSENWPTPDCIVMKQCIFAFTFSCCCCLISGSFSERRCPQIEELVDFCHTFSYLSINWTSSSQIWVSGVSPEIWS